MNNEEIIISLVDEASKVLVTLRYLTLDSVDAIVEWRNRLNYLISRIQETGVDKHDFSFNYKNENYLMKIKDDTLFLKDSWLSKFFHFSSKSDPFLIIPSQINPNNVTKVTKKKINKLRKPKNEVKKPKLIRLDLDFSICKKIKQFEMVLVEEAISDFFLLSNNWSTNISNEDTKLSIEPGPPKDVENDDKSPSKAEDK